MHPSTMLEMKRFVEQYLNKDEELNILDIGSLDENGTYRGLFDGPKWRYVGLDVRSGRNVDIVSADPYRYPIEAESFDVVISGQTLEHVEDTFRFIREAARVMKRNGAACIIAPWTYQEHRYPVDCWRVLPDGMRYLLEKVAGLWVVEVYKNDQDCVGIAKGVR